MLIHRIAAQLYTAEALQTVEAGLDSGEDVTLAVSQSGRTLMAAADVYKRQCLSFPLVDTLFRNP